MLATADILGRSCADSDQVLDNIALFRQYCAELGVLDRPWRFASDHARFTYFRSANRDPEYAAYDDTRLTVTVLSGLPGVGKDLPEAHQVSWVDTSGGPGKPVGVREPRRLPWSV